MINGELLDVLINLVEDAGGALFIQAGKLAERPETQQNGTLFIDTTTRSMSRFNEQNWECLLSSRNVMDPAVSEAVTESSRTFEATKHKDPSPIIRAKSPF